MSSARLPAAPALPHIHCQEHSACPSVFPNLHNKRADARPGTEVLDAGPRPGYRGDQPQEAPAGTLYLLASVRPPSTGRGGGATQSSSQFD